MDDFASHYTRRKDNGALRHTFASWSAQRGMKLYALKEMLGHSDIKQTQVYATLSPDSLAAAIQVLG